MPGETFRGPWGIPHLRADSVADPAKDRVVAEPDARNSKAVGRFLRSGLEPGPKVQLPDKEAQLVFLDRDKFEFRAAEQG
ncbi:hypothetical protein ACLH0K_15320 [Arthrobacter sp. MPF02]|uniref:hypothetical protein n=1 Tax=Arthrobacter sp. MPF02 TaxID=3388492 RepID=UPI0039855D70